MDCGCGSVASASGTAIPERSTAWTSRRRRARSSASPDRTAPARARSSRSWPARPRADAGEIELGGRAWDPATDRDRVAVVHQEPQLFPNLTVAENLMVGREGTRALVRGLDAQERSLMEDLAILDYADRPLGGVPLAIQQRVEIGRALARDAHDLPVRRAELGTDPGGVRGPVPADAPPGRRRPGRPARLAPDRGACPARRPRGADPRRRVHHASSTATR